jgi:hypothetical protein
VADDLVGGQRQVAAVQGIVDPGPRPGRLRYLLQGLRVAGRSHHCQQYR